MIRLHKVFWGMSLAIFFLGSLQGCSWFHSAKASAQRKSSFLLENIQFINPEPLKKGGTIQIVPFTAGIEVEASQDLDRMVLAMIQGVTEVINAERHNENLNVVFGEEAENADFRMTGHITRFHQTFRFRKFFSKKYVEAVIEGKLVSERTGETILIFTHRKKIPIKESNIKNLGRMMGHDVGNYIVSVL